MVKYTKEILQNVVSSSSSFADVTRALGVVPHGGAQNHLKKRIIHFGIDYSHFKGKAWSKGVVFTNRRKSINDILIVLPEGSNRAKSEQLRRALKESGVEEKCSLCGLSASWNNKPLILEVDHIDGNYLNNLFTNLRFVCPNCHTQTPNYKSRNGGRAADCVGLENQSG